MKFAIAGVSGKTGRIAAERLIERGHAVRVIVRDAAKGKDWNARRAAHTPEVAVADLADVRALTQALHGVDGAYLLIPPSMTATSFRAYQDGIAKSLVAAVREARVPHVVLLSSIGAQVESGTGPIAGLHVAEKLLREVEGTALTSLRAGYFVENLAGVLGAAKGQGTLPSFYPADLAIPMISTRDIGEVAADLLIEHATAKGKATNIVELGTDRTHAQVAEALSKLLAKPVRVDEAPVAAVSAAFQSFGFSKDLADLYQEMTSAIRSGIVKFEGGHRRIEAREPLETTLAGLLG